MLLIPTIQGMYKDKPDMHALTRAGSKESDSSIALTTQIDVQGTVF